MTKPRRLILVLIGLQSGSIMVAWGLWFWSGYGVVLVVTGAALMLAARWVAEVG